MRSAPSVDYPVGRSRFLLMLMFALQGAGTVLALAWLAVARVDGPRVATVAAALALALAGPTVAWIRSPRGRLSWNGMAWHWSGSDLSSEAAPRVTLDLQFGLLLHWPAGGMPRWLWLERGSDPLRWDDLRRAVYFRGRPDARMPASTP